jgi:hypothetical protein
METWDPALGEVVGRSTGTIPPMKHSGRLPVMDTSIRGQNANTKVPLSVVPSVKALAVYGPMRTTGKVILPVDLIPTSLRWVPLSIEVDYGANNIMVVQVSPGTSLGGGLGYAHFNTYTPPDSIGTVQGLAKRIAREIDKVYGGDYCGCR